jgi:hypothetical protein
VTSQKVDQPPAVSTESPPDLVLSDNDDFPLYTAAEAAGFFRMSKWWVLKEVREGRLEYVENGNKYLFKPRHIRAAANRREVDPATRGRKTVAGTPTVPAQRSAA